MTHRIAVMGGDGVGPELVEQGVRVLEHVAALDGIRVELVHLPHGGAHYRATGVLMDSETIDLLQTCHSLLFGAAGDPLLPNGTTERALILDVSRDLGLCVGVRMAYLHDARLTPLKGRGRGSVDVAIVRDTTEGEMPLPGGRLHPGTDDEVAITSMVHTRRGVDRAVRLAFDLARSRRGRVDLVAQSNVVVPHQLWEEVFDDVKREQPDIEGRSYLPDHAAMQAVLDPGSFDVIVTNLLTGGVLTDLFAALVGGIGLVGSSRINPLTGFGMFEPAHGSAPKYTGQGVVSPLATFRAVSMLLDNLGEKASARRIERAVDRVLERGSVPDATARSGLSTAEVTDRVLDAMTETR